MDTFSIPVIYKKNKNDLGVRALLPVGDLLFLRVIGKYIYFYGKGRKEYYLQATFSDWRIILDGCGFDEVDRGTIVNVNNISFIYSDLQQIHFGDDADGVFCPVARAHIARLRYQNPHIPIRISGEVFGL